MTSRTYGMYCTYNPYMCTVKFIQKSSELYFFFTAPVLRAANRENLNEREGQPVNTNSGQLLDTSALYEEEGPSIKALYN